ncbi:hypothetical protein [Streptomyces profundus]|uniref:hypothetical protein n=1 Tax=Streptomyces profundus TaxID=2867410 RepID=UPI001D1692F1|nr:hypothetical protein [Streptomyces sp. MA3_2.13]UED83082.1 hypothetical protein K4G22_01795 [Streptomyces sp. MA3_2.13]
MATGLLDADACPAGLAAPGGVWGASFAGGGGREPFGVGWFGRLAGVADGVRCPAGQRTFGVGR